jgi:hypothetical protein
VRARGRSIAALTTLTVAALIALGPTAQAQNGGGFGVSLFGSPSGRPIAATSVPVSISGQVAVTFHGDSGSGCAASGLCGYSGTIIVRPQTGDLTIETLRSGHRIQRLIAFDIFPVAEGDTTMARVVRSAPGQQGGQCADAEAATSTSQSAIRGGAITITLLSAGGSLLSTRCAGPLDADLAAVSPRATIPLRFASRGGITVDMSRSGTFAAHGFAGTVNSTLVLRFGRASNAMTGASQFPPGIKTERVRIVTELLRLIAAHGRLGVAVRGASDPMVCRLLDSCGLTGTFSLSGAVHGLTAQVVATGPASRPYGDFLAALGLTAAGRAAGITVALFGTWAQGRVVEDVGQAGACRNSAPGNEIFLELGGSRPAGSLRGSASGPAWRTRCPGPDVSEQSPAFDAALPQSALARPVFTIGLRPAAALEDDGYVMTPTGHLSVVVRRGPVSQQVLTQPTP